MKFQRSLTIKSSKRNGEAIIYENWSNKRCCQIILTGDMSEISTWPWYSDDLQIESKHCIKLTNLVNRPRQKAYKISLLRRWAWYPKDSQIESNLTLHHSNNVNSADRRDFKFPLFQTRNDIVQRHVVIDVSCRPNLAYLEYITTLVSPRVHVVLHNTWKCPD